MNVNSSVVILRKLAEAQAIDADVWANRVAEESQKLISLKNKHGSTIEGISKIESQIRSAKVDLEFSETEASQLSKDVKLLKRNATLASKNLKAASGIGLTKLNKILMNANLVLKKTILDIEAENNNISELSSRIADLLKIEKKACSALSKLKREIKYTSQTLIELKVEYMSASDRAEASLTKLKLRQK